jgi:hypothetical protein
MSVAEQFVETSKMIMVSVIVLPHFQLLNKLVAFYELWYECLVSGGVDMRWK